MSKGKALIYARVSTEEQKKKGYSIDKQVDECVAYAKRNGYEVVKVFKEEGRSAKDLKRPVLQGLFKHIKQHKNDVDVVIYKWWNRLSRGEDSDIIELARFFGKYDVTPLSVTENNDNTPIANLMRKITQAMNKYELEIDSERTKAGLSKKAELGHFPGKAPVGYLNVRDENDRGYIIVDEEIKPHIKNIFKYYASGQYSMESLGRKMYLEGFKNKHGEAYPARKFEEILKNVFYIGKFVWAKQTYEGKHTAIIDNKLFYKVQSMFKQDDKPVQNDKNFTYSKFIRCADCGRVLTAEMQKGGHNSGSYVYYHCGNKKYHNSLKGMSIREEAIDLAVQEIIGAVEIPSGIIRRLKCKILNCLDELYFVENRLINTRSQRLKELEQLIKKSYEDKILGKLPASMTDEIFKQQYEGWVRERDLIAIEIKESNDINRTIYKNIDLIIDFCNHIPELYVKSDLDNKRTMLRLLIEEILYNHIDTELSVKLKPIFEALRMIKESEKVRTLESPVNSEVWEYLEEQVEELVNSKVRTLKTLIVSNKKAPEGADFKNGAPDGIRTHAYRNHNPRS